MRWHNKDNEWTYKQTTLYVKYSRLARQTKFKLMLTMLNELYVKVIVPTVLAFFKELL